MKKFSLFVNFEKEENYLNEMALMGWEMQRYSWFGFYTFKKAEPKERHYCIDYRTFNNRTKYADYVNFLDEAGWKQVSGTYYSGYRFFLPRSNQAEMLEFFSDEDSRRQGVKHLARYCLYSFIISLASMIIFWRGALDNPLVNIFNPRSWYLTPGLWKMTGPRFVFSFLFETPFVIFRSLVPFFLIVFTLISGIWTFRAYREQKK